MSETTFQGSQAQTTVRDITILLGSITTLLVTAALAPALPGMAEAFKDVPNGALMVRLMLTLPGIFTAVSSPFVGVLLDRVGRKPIIIVSSIVYGLAGASGFVAGSLTTILIGRVLLGLSVAGLMTGFTALLSDYFTGSKLNQFMGYQGAALGLGGVVFQLLAGYLAAVGWRYPFLIYLFAVVLLPGVVFTVDELQLEEHSSVQDDQASKKPFPIKILAPIYAIALLGVPVFFISLIELPFFLTEQLGASTSQVGIALSVQTFSSIFAALLFQRLKDRLSFQGILALIYLVMGINHAFTFFAPSFAYVLVGQLIGGVGFGFLVPNFNVWISSSAPPFMRGRALGGFTTVLFVGQFLIPFVARPITNIAGLKGLFGYAAGFSFFMAIILVGIAANK
jgi:MFS family permease